VFLARINGAVAQAGDLRVEQLADVRRTCGALIHCTNADVLGRRPVTARLVAAVLRLAASGLELGLAVASFQVHAVDERQVLDRRDRRFGETFAHFKLAVTIRNRCAGAQDFAVRLRSFIATGSSARTTPFGAEGDSDRAFAPRAA